MVGKAKLQRVHTVPNYEHLFLGFFCIQMLLSTHGRNHSSEICNAHLTGVYKWGWLDRNAGYAYLASDNHLKTVRKRSMLLTRFRNGTPSAASVQWSEKIHTKISRCCIWHRHWFPHLVILSVATSRRPERHVIERIFFESEHEFGLLWSSSCWLRVYLYVASQNGDRFGKFHPVCHHFFRGVKGCVHFLTTSKSACHRI